MLILASLNLNYVDALPHFCRSQESRSQFEVKRNEQGLDVYEAHSAGDDVIQQEERISLILVPDVSHSE